MSQVTADSIQRLIKAHADIFGNEVALSAVKNIKGLQIDKDIRVKKISGDAVGVLREVISSYAPVSGTLSYQILNPQD